MALTTDAIESAKSLLNAGAENSKIIRATCHVYLRLTSCLAAKALIMLDERSH